MVCPRCKRTHPGFETDQGTLSSTCKRCHIAPNRLAEPGDDPTRLPPGKPAKTKKGRQPGQRASGAPAE